MADSRRVSIPLYSANQKVEVFEENTAKEHNQEPAETMRSRCESFQSGGEKAGFKNRTDKNAGDENESDTAHVEGLSDPILSRSAPHNKTMQEIASDVERQAVKAAVCSPPDFEPLSMDLLPEQYWQPVFQNCPPTFTTVASCDYFKPTPRLCKFDMNELIFSRALQNGQVNVSEPLEARQAFTQLLTLGVRSRKDVYTQSSPANDIASSSACAQMKRSPPDFVDF